MRLNSPDRRKQPGIQRRVLGLRHFIRMADDFVPPADCQRFCRYGVDTVVMVIAESAGRKRLPTEPECEEGKKNKQKQRSVFFDRWMHRKPDRCVPDAQASIEFRILLPHAAFAEELVLTAP